MNPIDLHVGQRIRMRRIFLGLSQNDLAVRIGVRFQQIQKYETGMNRVSASRLWNTAEALDVPIEFFFQGISVEDENPSSRKGLSVDMANLLEDRKVMTLLRCYSKIPDSQRNAVLEIVKSMSDAAERPVSNADGP